MHSSSSCCVMMVPVALTLFVMTFMASVASAFLVSTSSLSTNRHVSAAAVAGTPHLHQQPRAARAKTARPGTMMADDSVMDVKSKVLQLAAVMDRGGMANPGISSAYLGSKDDMRLLVESLAELGPVNKPLTSADLSGRWELVYTTVELFRASPFFQMVEAGYDDPDKSNLFFKLHQLQTGSWGASSIGRITQTLDLIESVPGETDTQGGGVEGSQTQGNSTASVGADDMSGGSGGSGTLESEVDLIILPLTSIPLVGFWKLLPTFGGCIATKAKCSLTGDNNQVVQLVVESTKLKAVKDVPLLPLAGPLFEGMEFPTGEVAKKVVGSVPVTKQTVVYIDDSLRVMEDKAGELYIYARPLKME